MKTRIFVLIAFMAFIAVAASSGRKEAGTKYVYATVTDAGDTMMVMYWKPTTAVNAEDYLCSLLVGADTVVITDTADGSATVAEICALMEAAFTADATAAGLVVASTPAGDSMIYITQIPGIAAFTLIMGDTASAIDTVTAEVKSRSINTDTVTIFSTLTPSLHSSIKGRIILQASSDTLYGYGDSDSGFVWLYGYFQGTYTLIDSAVRNALPCTLSVDQPDTGLFNPNTYGEYLRLVTTVSDTCTIGAQTNRHSIDYVFILR